MKNTLIALTIAALLIPSVSFAAERVTIESLQARIIVLLQEQIRVLKEKIVLMEKLEEVKNEEIAVTSAPTPEAEKTETDYDRFCKEAIAKDPEKTHYYKKDQYSRAQRCFVTKSY